MVNRRRKETIALGPFQFHIRYKESHRVTWIGTVPPRFPSLDYKPVGTRLNDTGDVSAASLYPNRVPVVFGDSALCYFPESYTVSLEIALYNVIAAGIAYAMLNFLNL